MSGGAKDPFSAGFDHYFGLARNVWELAARALQSAGDPAAQAQGFSEALAALYGDWQPPPPPPWMQGWAQTMTAWPSVAGGWPLGMPGGMSGMPGGMPGMAAGAPGASWMPGGFDWAGSAWGDLPALGLTRERQEAARRLAALGTRMLERQQELATHWKAFWDDALRTLGDEVARRIAAGKAPGSIRELYDLWVECAEGAWARMAHGPGYLESQARLVDALSAWRAEQRNQMDAALRALDLPTRGELNSLHLRVRRLRAELRRLEKLLASGSAPAVASRPAPRRGTRARPRKART